MKTDLETLITALSVKIDDELVTNRWCGRPPLLSDSELVCLAVAQALLQVHNEARWLRFADQRLGALFPYRPKRPGCNKRLRAALPLGRRVIRLLARDTDRRVLCGNWSLMLASAGHTERLFARVSTARRAAWRSSGRRYATASRPSPRINRRRCGKSVVT
ncbi:MAG: hypothetical protein WAL72_00170 [Streptosporangiaceae bacterium]